MDKESSADVFFGVVKSSYKHVNSWIKSRSLFFSLASYPRAKMQTWTCLFLSKQEDRKHTTFWTQCMQSTQRDPVITPSTWLPKVASWLHQDCVQDVPTSGERGAWRPRRANTIDFLEVWQRSAWHFFTKACKWCNKGTVVIVVDPFASCVAAFKAERKSSAFLKCTPLGTITLPNGLNDKPSKWVLWNIENHT